MVKNALVLYPAPGMGHVASMVELAHLLLRHHFLPNLTIHLLLLPPDAAVDSFLQTYAHPNLTLHRLPPTSSPSLASSPNVSRAAVDFESFRLSTYHVSESLRMISEGSVVRALIVDFFCTTAVPIAAEMGIPVYYFFTSGAAALAVYLYLPTVDREVSGSFKELGSTQLHIPGLPTLRAIHMPEPVLDRNDPAYNDILYFSLHLPKSNGIIVNTFETLEPKAIRAIANGSCVPNAPTPPLYYIGPIISQLSITETKHECLTWLDQQSSKSVVFLCFGSRGSFPLDQVKEIAAALEKSGLRFLWVLKSPPPDEESKQIYLLDAGARRGTSTQNEQFLASPPELGAILPRGFLERTQGRGMVVESWAPQTHVLAHGSVGGFVTHCGWNSVLEAVATGVPMIAWPLYAEQFINRTVLVEDMKMAIAVEQREGDGFVTKDEIERRVRELMESESGRELRERSSKMREEALAALGESGSSMVALDKLVQSWSSEHCPK